MTARDLGAGIAGATAATLAGAAPWASFVDVGLATCSGVCTVGQLDVAGTDVVLHPVLAANGRPRATFDFDDTARLGMAASDGVTGTSDGAVFLAQAVSEPARAVPLPAGPGVVGACHRRRG